MNVKHKGGFSLIEILIALLIIGVMAGIAGPGIARYLSRSKVTSTKTSLQNLKSAVELYNNDMGKYPSTRDGLEVLVEQPAQKGNWQGPYVEGEKALKDGWGNDYEYNSPPLKYKSEFKHFEIISGGASNSEDTEMYSGG